MKPRSAADRFLQAARAVASALAIVAVLAAAVVLGGCPQPRPLEVTVNTGNSGGPLTHDQIVAQAKREGELDWYTSLPARDAQTVAAAFMKRYPFIACRPTRSSTFEISQRVQSELARGQASADVLHVLDTGIFVNLQQAGQLYHYESPEAKYVQPGFRSPGWWTACREVVTVLATRPGGPQLKRWRDLLSLPKDVTIGLKDAETSGSAYATYYLLREKYGYSFWQRIAQHPFRIYRSEAEMVAALERGEVGVLAGLMADPSLPPDKVKLIWPTDGVPIVLGPVAILSTAAHPNAAKLFVDFLLSREGQTLLRDQTGAYPARSGLGPPKGLPPLGDLPVLKPRTRWEIYTALQEPLQSEYHDFFRPQTE